MKINDKLESFSDGGYSLEFFPPKTEKGVENLKKRVENFYQLSEGIDRLPLFIDLTWGAGGSTSNLTMGLAKYWTNLKSEINVNMHLTCTNMAVEELDQILKEVDSVGIDNIVALRGDPPRDEGEWKMASGGFRCAMDLVNYINRNYGNRFCQAVAGYPEGHNSKIKEIDSGLPLSPSEQLRLSCDPVTGKYYVCSDSDYWADLHYLKRKVDSGGDLIITQLFFDVRLFLQFVEDCRSLTITCPILPGIMLVQSTGGFRRMTSMCRTKVPSEIWKRIGEIEKVELEAEKIEEKSNQILEYGEELGKEMCRQLYDGGVKFFHLYTLNRERVARSVIQYICQKLLVD